MKIAIVGAGATGLAAAYRLQKSGHEAIVFEKSRGYGGRMSTRRDQGFVWDTGATSIAPRGKAIQSLILEEFADEELVQITKPIYLQKGLKPAPGNQYRMAVPRYTYLSGITKFAKRLAEGLTVRLATQVNDLQRSGKSYVIAGETFDGVILTQPVPQTAALLWSLGESRATASVRYRCCLSILLGYDKPDPVTPYFALLDPEQRHPLTWLSLESVKCPNRAPAGHSAMVIQAGPSYSLDYYSENDEAIIKDLNNYIVQLYGSAYKQPVVAHVKRWKYSQPEAVGSYEYANPEGSTLLLAGDGLSAGRVEDAFDCGLRVAQQLIDTFKTS